jgi:hypothetical protein
VGSEVYAPNLSNKKIYMNKQQKSSDKVWTDESGSQIPFNRTTALERLQEKNAWTLLTGAQKANKTLTELKQMAEKLCQDVYELSLSDTDTEGANRKGQYTWHNFDRSIKIVKDVQSSIVFDDLTIQAAKEKLDQFIDAGMHGVDSFMREIVMSAFQKTSGVMDVKKVLELKKYKTRTKDPIYHEAMELIDKAIRRPSSKDYFRVFLRNDKGEYDLINLNFSAI